MGIKFFFDSYALIEVIKGSPNYIKYLEEEVTITILNLVEVMNSVYNEFGEEEAKQVYNKFKECVEELNQGIIIEALKVKRKYRKRNLSYADCIGYSTAKSKGMLFLTGDEGFKDLEQVEFVKSSNE